MRERQLRNGWRTKYERRLRDFDSRKPFVYASLRETHISRFLEFTLSHYCGNDTDTENSIEIESSVGQQFRIKCFRQIRV